MVFSIIVPTFNNQETLEKCLQAITKIKGFDNCELIVADDSSTDFSVDIAKRYKAKIVSNQDNKGAAFTRNIGAQVAEGEILLFVDSDVVLLSKDVLSFIKNGFKLSNVCGVFGIYDRKIAFNNFFSGYKHLYNCFTQEATPKYCPVASSSIFAVPRKNFLKAGGFNENYPGVMAEDVEFSIRLAIKENKLFLKDSRIRGLHLKNYNFKTLLITNYLRTKGISKTIQKKDNKRMYLKANVNYSKSPLLLAASTIGFFILSLIWHFFIFPALLSILLFFLSQINFFKYLKKNKNTSFAILSIFFSLMEILLIISWALYFQLLFKIKKDELA